MNLQILNQRAQVSDSRTKYPAARVPIASGTIFYWNKHCKAIFSNEIRTYLQRYTLLCLIFSRQ